MHLKVTFEYTIYILLNIVNLIIRVPARTLYSHSIASQTTDDALFVLIVLAACSCYEVRFRS